LIKNYYSLIKPGIIYGNIITVSAGFFVLGLREPLYLYFLTLLGISLVMGCGCALNNLYDQDIDRLMSRTKKRVLAQGLIPCKYVIFYAVTLGIIGLLVLYFLVNPLTALIGFIGLFFYLCVYTCWLKRSSVLGTVVGGVAGSVPPVVGYCAVANQVDATAISLFVILFIWQLPHAYAIALYRLDDYKKASIPVFPVIYGTKLTKLIMIFLVIAFIVSVSIPFFLGAKGWIYLFISQELGFIWLLISIKAYVSSDDTVWGKKMFIFSIITIFVLCISLIL
jgi:heme o synthase